MLCNSKMTVITGSRTQELERGTLSLCSRHLLCPRRLTSKTMGYGMRNNVVHKVKARRAIYDDLIRRYTCELCSEGSRRRKTPGVSVVVCKRTAISQVRSGVQLVKHRLRQRRLCRAWLSASHIKFEVFLAKCTSLLSNKFKSLVKLSIAHLLISVLLRG